MINQIIITCTKSSSNFTVKETETWAQTHTTAHPHLAPEG